MDTTPEMESPITAAPLPPGITLGTYVIESVMRQEASRTLYLARDTEDNEKIVLCEFLPQKMVVRGENGIDVLPTVLGEKDGLFEWGMENFTSKSRILSTMRHPSLGRVRHVFTAAGTAYCTMRYAQAESLESSPESRRLYNGEREARKFLRTILSALSRLHESGLLHLGIRPANILISRAGNPLLTGHAMLDYKFSRKVGLQMTEDLYAAPELSDPASPAGPWSDVYAVGALMHYVLTGESPVQKRSRQPLADRTELQSSYTLSFLSGIDRALDMVPLNRWQSAGEWLETLMEQAHSSAALTGVVEAREPVAVPHHVPRSRSGMLTGVLAAIVVGAAVGVPLYLINLQQQYNEQLSAKDSSIRDLKSAIVAVHGANEELQSINEELAERQKKLDARLDSLNQEKQTLLGSLSELESQKDRVEDELELMIDKMDDARRKQQEIQTALEQAIAKSETEGQQTEALRVQLAQLEEERRKMEADQTRLEQENSRINEQLDIAGLFVRRNQNEYNICLLEQMPADGAAVSAEEQTRRQQERERLQKENAAILEQLKVAATMMDRGSIAGLKVSVPDGEGGAPSADDMAAQLDVAGVLLLQDATDLQICPAEEVMQPDSEPAPAPQPAEDAPSPAPYDPSLANPQAPAPGAEAPPEGLLPDGAEAMPADLLSL